LSDGPFRTKGIIFEVYQVPVGLLQPRAGAIAGSECRQIGDLDPSKSASHLSRTENRFPGFVRGLYLPFGICVDVVRETAGEVGEDGKGVFLRGLVVGKVGSLLPDILASGNPERVALHHARRPRVGRFSVQQRFWNLGEESRAFHAIQATGPAS
jgi:hypothetical protein